MVGFLFYTKVRTSSIQRSQESKIKEPSWGSFIFERDDHGKALFTYGAHEKQFYLDFESLVR